MLVLAGCSEPAPEGPDAAVADARPSSPGIDASTPEIPGDAASHAPSPPVFTPCAEGWTEELVDDIIVCNPWPHGGPTCPDGQTRPPGQPLCKFVGSTCPVGKWPEGLPASGVLYVDALASGKQDGAIDSPYATISQALSAAAPADTIAVAKGYYEEPLTVGKDVTIIGACAEETILSLGHEGFYLHEDYCKLLVDVQGAKLTLKDLQLQDSYTGIQGSSGASIELVGTSFHHMVVPVTGSFTGIRIADSSLRNERAYVSADCVPVSSALADDDTSEESLAQAASSCPPVSTPSACLKSFGLLPPALIFRTEASVESVEVSLSRTVLTGKVIEENTHAAVSVSISDSYVGTATLRSPTTVHRTVCKFGEQLNFGGHAVVADTTCGLLLQGPGSQVSRHRGRVGALCPESGAVHLGSDLRVAGYREQVFFSGPCQASLDRVSVQGAWTGVTAHGAAQVDVEDLSVRDVVGSGKPGDWTILPVSVGVYTSAEMTIERFALTGSPVVGAQLGPAATSLHLVAGRIADNLIGVNVQNPNDGSAFAYESVIWENNEVDIDAQELQEPAPVAEFVCDDEADNDGDSRVDCGDDDCAFAPACSL